MNGFINGLVKAKQWSVLVAATLLAITANAAGSKWPTPKDVAVAQAGFSAAGLAALDAKMQEAVDKRQVSGIVTLLARHGHVAAFNMHGVQAFETNAPMTPDSLFRIYSMTKPITGVAMMQLYEKGLWKLDDPITKFVPELANLKVQNGVDGEGKAILVNVEHTATMRS